MGDEKMKAKKKLRQEQKKIDGQKQRELNRPTVLLKRDELEKEYYRWKCPNHEGSFSWSKRINKQWGHPDHLAFCAVCFTYFNIEFESKVLV
jgi:hypothetical protein